MFIMANKTDEWHYTFENADLLKICQVKLCMSMSTALIIKFFFNDSIIRPRKIALEDAGNFRKLKSDSNNG